MTRRVKDDMDFFLIQIKGSLECSHFAIVAEDFKSIKLILTCLSHLNRHATLPDARG